MTALATHDIVTVQTRFHRKDGTWITLESAARNYMDFPELEGFLVSSRDITQHVALEKTLRQSARDSAELIENAPRRMRSTPRS